jgi:ADP-ribosylglycohydrolase
MRSAVIGAYFANDPEKRRAFVLASSQLTHRSWQAVTAALAIAECVALAMQSQHSPNAHVLKMLRELSTENEWQNWVSRIETSLASNASVADFVQACELRSGVTGYALHVVPVAVYAWLRHPMDFRAAMISALECGGDTDTVGAVLGALAGATVGEGAVPNDWLNQICEWPRSVSFMQRVATRLAMQSETRKSQGAVSYF